MNTFKKLMLGSAISALGSGLFRACAMVFFLNSVHLPVKGIGLALSAGALLGILMASPTGRLADKWGSIPVLIAVLMIRAMAYSALAFAHSMFSYALWVVIALAGDYLNPSLNQTLVGVLLSSEERTRALGILKAVKNSAITVGLLIGSLVLKFGTDEVIRGTMFMNGLSFVVLAWVISTLLHIKKPQSCSVRENKIPLTVILSSPLRNPWFLMLTGANGVLLLYDTTLVVLLPMWIIHSTHLSPNLVPLFFAVNTVLTVCLQLWLPKTEAGTSWKLGVGLGIVTFLISCFFFSFATQHALLEGLTLSFIAVIALTLAESFCGIASWNLSYAIAGSAPYKHRFAEHLGVFNMGYAINALLGPVLMSSIILPLMPYGWWILAGLFLSAGFLMSVASKHLAINSV